MDLFVHRMWGKDLTLLISHSVFGFPKQIIHSFLADLKRHLNHLLESHIHLGQFLDSLCSDGSTFQFLHQYQTILLFMVFWYTEILNILKVKLYCLISSIEKFSLSILLIEIYVWNNLISHMHLLNKERKGKVNLSSWIFLHYDIHVPTSSHDFFRISFQGYCWKSHLFVNMNRGIFQISYMIIYLNYWK